MRYVITACSNFINFVFTCPFPNSVQNMQYVYICYMVINARKGAVRQLLGAEFLQGIVFIENIFL